MIRINAKSLEITLSSYLVMKWTRLILALAIVGLLETHGNGATPSSDDPKTPTKSAESPSATGIQTIDQWLDKETPDFISRGKLLLNVRGRYEYADQDGLEASNAPTIRTRLGYETAPLYGFRGLAELEDVTILGSEDNFNQAGLSGAGRTVIADPETTEINRAWLGFEQFDTLFKFGRQRIILDNARFIGNVGWRQNEQTYDAASARSTVLPETTLFYGYVHNVNRVLGDDHPAGDFDSDSHLLNLSYSGLEAATVTAYGYSLDLEDSPAASTHTVGLRAKGSSVVQEPFKVHYLGEYAWQTDAADNPNDYKTDYYHFNLGGTYERLSLTGGYERLNSDRNRGFSTPLATLHKFNGWADAFLTTPAAGLVDVYGKLGIRLPYSIPLSFVWHDFTSDNGDRDFGNELDIVASREFGAHWKALTKYAHYNGGSDGPADRDRFWVQLELSF